MASERQIAANRNNAKKSTGPRSDAGRRRSRLNALHHGLAIAIGGDLARALEIERLARILAADRPHIAAAARDAAAAEVDLRRIREVRATLFDELSRKSEATLKRRAELVAGLVKLERYERRAFSRHKRALRGLWVD
jgi:hypothetical protein